MTDSSAIQKATAWMCCACVLLTSGPLSVSSYAAPSAIGWITASGAVNVRNTPTRETTIFSGDRIHAFPSSSATVVLTSGHRLEVAGGSEIQIAAANTTATIALTGGRVEFSASTRGRFQIDTQSLSVSAEPNEAGNVSSVERDIVSVAARKGDLEVRNRETAETFLVKAGKTFVFGLHGKEPAATQTTPQQPPQKPPATVTIPTPTTGASASTKVLIIVGVGVAATITAILLTRDDSTASPSSP